MRITVVGSTDVPYTTAWHYAEAFAKLGHEVERAATRDQEFAGLHFDDGTHDVEVALVRVGRIIGDSFVIPEHVPFFTDDGVWAAQHPTIGNAQVHYLRSGCHGPEAHDSEPYPPWQGRWDVAFIGSSPGHPEWPQRVELIAHLREWFGDRFIHVGPGGEQVEDDSKLLWGYEDRPLRGHWLNRFLRSVPIVVGDSVLHDRAQPYWSERVYETWARGGFLIHPRNDFLAAELGLRGQTYPGRAWEPERRYDYPGEWTVLKMLIDDALAHPERTEEERRWWQEFVRTHCTYEVRCGELLAILGLS